MGNTLSQNVYVVCYDGNKSPIKVGIAKNVNMRLGQLQTSSPYKLFVFKSFMYTKNGLAHMIEQEFHSQMAEKRLLGEWFDIPPEEAVDIINKIAEKIIYVKKPTGYYRPLSSNEAIIMNYIIDFSRKNSRVPDLRLITAETGITNRRAFSAISSLQKKGYILISDGPEGKLLTTLYSY